MALKNSGIVRGLDKHGLLVEVIKLNCVANAFERSCQHDIVEKTTTDSEYDGVPIEREDGLTKPTERVLVFYRA